MKVCHFVLAVGPDLMTNTEMFGIGDDTQEDMERSMFGDTLAKLPNVWSDTKETAENMLTT